MNQKMIEAFKKSKPFKGEIWTAICVDKDGKRVDYINPKLLNTIRGQPKGFSPAAMPL